MSWATTSAVCVLLTAMTGPAAAETAVKRATALDYERDIKPILVRHCYECHGEGGSRGEVTLDGHKSLALLQQDTKLWRRVVENVRNDLMPPPKQPRLSEDERSKLLTWIRNDVERVDCRAPDPGRVTARRLNRREYNHSIQDLFGIEMEPSEDFPADDTGYGFDNIGDVLTMSPLLMEKYFAAAEKVVGRVVAAKPALPRQLAKDDLRVLSESAEGMLVREGRVQVARAGKHRVSFTLSVFSFTPFKGTARVTASIDGKAIFNKRIVAGNRNYTFAMDVPLDAGDHVLLLTTDLTAATPARSIRILPEELAVEGPVGKGKTFLEWPAPHRRVFFEAAVPAGAEARLAYAREILNRVATRAFRRPVDDKTLDALVALAVGAEKSTGKFEAGIAHALQAILVSPRFLFRVEGQPNPDDPLAVRALDQHSLATRLSSLLWQGPPDAELLALADAGKLEAGMKSQAKRLLSDGKSARFFAGFVGQWLRSSDIETVPLNNGAMSPRMRQSMRAETEMFLSYIMREDRDMMETVTANYTFLNEALAKHYGVMGVEGSRLRKIELPKDDVRGGLLTQGTFLAVTSNPSRTSPVKRGLFVLDNLLGAPPPPPPAMVANLEDAAKDGKKPKTVREQLAIHRENPACASCHERMDPLGLAFENFDAIGRWRDVEAGQPIAAGGVLASGEKFASIRDLRTLIGKRREPFYRNLVSKFFTFALGRGLEPADDCTVESIVAKMMVGGGKFSTMLEGVLDSPAFRRRRGDGPKPGTLATEARAGGSATALGNVAVEKRQELRNGKSKERQER